MFYLVYASKLYSDQGYEGPVELLIGLDRIRGRQIRIPLDTRGNDFDVGQPLLDSSNEFHRTIFSTDLSHKIFDICVDLYREITFACGWSRAYTATEEFVEGQIEMALNYLMWTRDDL